MFFIRNPEHARSCIALRGFGGCLLLLGAILNATLSRADVNGACDWGVSAPIDLPRCLVAPSGSFFPGLGTTSDDPGGQFLPADKRSFCARSEFDIQRNLLNHPETETLAFYNPPGWTGYGMCWLHSRFQRFASYLAHFRPDLGKPSPSKAKEIIEAIASGEKVVEVPGFATLDEFSRAYGTQIATELSWMSLHKAWKLAHRLTDRSNPLEQGALDATLNQLYEQMSENPHLVFVREKKESNNPLDSHSELIIDISRTFENGVDKDQTGYRVRMLNSNSPQEILTANFRFGDSQLHYCMESDSINPRSTSLRCRDVMIYPDYEDEIPVIENAIRSYCQPNKKQRLHAKLKNSKPATTP